MLALLSDHSHEIKQEIGIDAAEDLGISRAFTEHALGLALSASVPSQPDVEATRAAQSSSTSPRLSGNTTRNGAQVHV